MESETLFNGGIEKSVICSLFMVYFVFSLKIDVESKASIITEQKI